MREIIGRFGTSIAGLALILFFVAFAPNFVSPGNIVNVLKDTSFLAILALGFTLAFTVAELDLSIAETASLAAVVCGWLVQSQYPPHGRGRGCDRRSASLLGAFNGFGVTVLRIPSLIMTLGTAAIAKGLRLHDHAGHRLRRALAGGIHRAGARHSPSASPISCSG
jgi:ribose transport system permease protein